MEAYIKFNTIEDVKRFAEITSSKDYDIKLEAKDTVVDAKSVMCILGLDLTKPILLKADCKATGELWHQIKPFLSEKELLGWKR